MEISKYIKELLKDPKNLPLKYLEGNNIMYIREDLEDEGLNELLGFQLAKIFALNCQFHELTTIDKQNYIVSNSIENCGEFLIYYDFSLNDSNNLDDIKNNLKANFNNSNELEEDLIKLYIFDLLFCNCGRHPINWGVLKTKYKNKLYVLENLYLFDTLYKPAICSGEDNVELITNHIDYVIELVKEITVFKNTSEEDIVKKAIDLVNSVDEKVLEELITYVELVAGRKFIKKPNIKMFSQIRSIILTDLQTKEISNEKYIIIYR